MVVASERYFAYVEEREPVGCFLEDQDIELEPRKPMNPKVEYQSEISPAQSESQKVCRDNEVVKILCQWSKYYIDIGGCV